MQWNLILSNQLAQPNLPAVEQLFSTRLLLYTKGVLTARCNMFTLEANCDGVVTGLNFGTRSSLIGLGNEQLAQTCKRTCQQPTSHHRAF